MPRTPLSVERRRTLSITHHALSPPPSHHHLYIIHLLNWLQRFYRITLALKRPFVPKVTQSNDLLLLLLDRKSWSQSLRASFVSGWKRWSIPMVVAKSYARRFSSREWNPNKAASIHLLDVFVRSSTSGQNLPKSFCPRWATLTFTCLPRKIKK